MTDTVQLFVTCLVDSLFPEVGVATVETLTSIGFDVEFPQGQTCCGQPAYNAGSNAQAREMAQNTIRHLKGDDSPVVVPSGSCAAMIRHGYLDLFETVPSWKEEATALASRTYELSEFIVDRKARIGSITSRPGKVLYHASCHLHRTLGVKTQPLQVLRSIDGLEVNKLESDCCGFGGLFAIDHPEISSEMLNRKLEEIAKFEAGMVVGCDVGCLMHLEGGLRRINSPVRCAHLAQVLAGQQAGLR